MVLLLRTLFLLTIFLPMPALADAPLIFRAGNNDIRVREIMDFLVAQDQLPPAATFETAPVDLNGDGIDEIIYRQETPGCTAAANCLYVIGAISDKKPAHLLTLRARKIGISPEKSYGVKKIVVYNQKQNDFQYITYVWNAYTAAFEPQ